MSHRKLVTMVLRNETVEGSDKRSHNQSKCSSGRDGSTVTTRNEVRILGMIDDKGFASLLKGVDHWTLCPKIGSMSPLSQPIVLDGRLPHSYRPEKGSGWGFCTSADFLFILNR